MQWHTNFATGLGKGDGQIVITEYDINTASGTLNLTQNNTQSIEDR
jgi:hypothetical protein